MANSDAKQSEFLLRREELWRVQRAKLVAMAEQVIPVNPFQARKFGCVNFSSIVTFGDLDRLPLTTRAEIEADQLAFPLYGSNLTFPLDQYRRLHQTSGSNGQPVRWLDTAESWGWWLSCWGEVFGAACVTEKDRVAFTFSFGPFIGFWSAFETAAAMGAFCLPAGGMTSSARIRYLLDHSATVLCCTPTYALHLAEVATGEGVELASSRIRAIVVAGEPGGSVPGVRARMEAAWGARVFDHAGMTEMGAWGFECLERPGGIHVLETEFIAEVIDPSSGRQVEWGQDGELVLTNLGRVGSPLIRYRTGDRVRLNCEPCACGRCFAWAEGGVLGRADDMIIVRGNNVFPSAIESLIRTFAEIAEFRMVIRRKNGLDELTLELEPRDQNLSQDVKLAARVVDAVRDRLHFRPHARLVPPGTLPRFEMKAKRVVRIEREVGEEDS